jgi:alpha-tubulin suppressor-like RCC1 family protein
VRVRQGPGFLRGVTKVRAGDRFSCALDRDGHVWCWGFAGAGQLGDGTYGNAHLVRLRPVRVLGSNGPLGGVTDIDLGDDFACALRTDRSVWCWGGDYFGQLGDGSRGGIDHARKRAVPVHQGSGLLSSATQISVGADHACALKGNRTAVCWGDATSGQIGDGSTGGSSGIRWSAVPVKIGSGVFASLTAVSAGSFFSCAVKQSGSTWCWGDDSVGELGDGTKGDAQHLRLSPVRVLTSTSATLDRVTRVSAGGGHACALRSFGDPDGTVWCWGQDSSGQVGDGTTGDTDQLRLAAVQTDFR